MIEQKIEDNKRSVRYQKIKRRKHRAVLGLKHRVDDSSREVTLAGVLSGVQGIMFISVSVSDRPILFLMSQGIGLSVENPYRSFATKLSVPVNV